MADQPTHWTDNEEVLERYVLGRIDAQTQKVLDEHLAHCTQCQEAVRQETELARGIRRMGRDALKSRLSQRLLLQHGTAIPWPHVISVAAVLLIAVGAAIYTFWTPLETWYEEQVTESKSQAGEIAAAPQAAAEGEPPSAGKDAVFGRNEALVDKINRAKGAPEKLEQAPAVSEEAAPQELDADRDDRGIVAADVSTQASAWVQGMILPVATDEVGERTVPANEPTARARELEAADLRKARRQDQASGIQTISAELQQRPATSLPMAQQRLQLEQKGRAIETFVERTSQGLRLTMYFDPPIPERELQAARVEAVSEDSLLVVMPSQQIAYKIPPSFGTVQGVQLNTKKR